MNNSRSVLNFCYICGGPVYLRNSTWCSNCIKKYQKTNHIPKHKKRRKRYSAKYQPRKLRPLLHKLKEEAALCVTELKEEITPAEQLLIETFTEKGVPFEYQKVVPTKKNFYVITFFIPYRKGFIFVENDEWIRYTKQQELWDKARDFELKKMGFYILRFQSDFILKNPNKVVDLVVQKMNKY